MRRAAAGLALAGSLVVCSCASRQGAAPGALPQPALPPPAAAPAPTPQAPPITVEAPQVEPPSQKPAELPPPPSVAGRQTPPPPPQAKPKPRNRPATRSARSSKPPAAESKPAPTFEAKPPEPPKPVPAEEMAPELPESPAPVLGEVLTPEQRNLMFRELESNLSEARARTDEAVKRRPEARQDEEVTRVRSFIGQAEQLRGRDLRTALSLSRRALTLARELSPSSR